MSSEPKSLNTKSQNTNSQNIKSVFIIAGEQSGDLHGSSLIKELKAQSFDTRLIFNGLGGDLMESEGLNLLYHIKNLATIGFTDVLKKYGFYRNVIKDCVNYIKNNNPDVVILIDYPGFNLKIAGEIRKFYNKKIIYYISPQLWAWHEKRVYKIKKYIDKMLVVFPFEVEFYKKYGIDAEYTGHPLVSRINKFLAENPKLQRTFGSEKIITILPGSRKDEIKHHLPVLIDVLKQLSKEFNFRVNISIAPSLEEDAFKNFKNDIKNYNLTNESVYSLVLNSDLVLTKAGTSTMECSLIGTPYLIFYKTFPLNYCLLKPIVKVNYLGIINIIANENIIKEFIQKDFTSEKLLFEARKILTDNSYREQMTRKLRSVWKILGDKDASYNAARIIKETAQI